MSDPAFAAPPSATAEEDGAELTSPVTSIRLSGVQSFQVRFEYPVVFTRDLFRAEDRTLRTALTHKEPERVHRALVVVDRGVVDATIGLLDRIRAYFARHADALRLVEDPVIVPGGEEVKNEPALLSAMLEKLSARGMDRHSFVVAVGGGAMLDMVGYAAAITHRGVRLVRVPTTVLAQADSGVGVKNGVNAFGKKNFLGTFVPPFAVLCDTAFLDTLDVRDRRAGMAEAVKVALVRDPALFEWLRENAAALAAGAPGPLAELVRASAALHQRHIATGGDPFELGSARPLDYGHWIAHKLESLTEYRLRHGEAVAIGLALDSLYSARIGLCSAQEAESVIDLLEALGFHLWDEALERVDARGRLVALDGLEEFREHLGGELTVTMLQGIGRGLEVHEIDDAAVLACLRTLEARAKK